MPYKNIKQLPKQVQGLPILAQKMWMRSFNRAIKNYPEDRAFKIAWSIINQFYRKLPNGNWIRRK